MGVSASEVGILSSCVFNESLFSLTLSVARVEKASVVIVHTKQHDADHDVRVAVMMIVVNSVHYSQFCSYRYSYHLVSF